MDISSEYYLLYIIYIFSCIACFKERYWFVIIWKWNNFGTFKKKTLIRIDFLKVKVKEEKVVSQK